MGAKVMDFYWVTGASIMALLAYLIRDWRTLLLVASFPPALFLLLWMYVKQFCHFVTLYATHSEKEHREKNLKEERKNFSHKSARLGELTVL